MRYDVSLSVLMTLSILFVVSFSDFTIAQDRDGDGHFEAGYVNEEGRVIGDDCDDSDPNRFPGNVEVADRDNHDEDCDPTTVGTLEYDDNDNDGFLPSWACNESPSGGLNCGKDCNDTDPAIHPHQIDICNRKDDNCNGSIDEHQKCGQIPQWIDEEQAEIERERQERRVNELTEEASPDESSVDTEIQPKINTSNIQQQNKNSSTNGSTCFNAIQGKIAWNRSGTNRQWSDSNVKRLCDGAENSTAPAICFNQVLHEDTPTGQGLTEWNWQNAIALCAGSQNASKTINCYKNEINDGSKHETAIDRCNP